METDSTSKLTVIACAGYAGAGKDTFADYIEKSLPEGFPRVRRKMADELKEGINQFLKYLNLPEAAFTEDRSIKEKLRPLMVEAGRYARSQDKGVFANIVKRCIDSDFKVRGQKVVLVTDLRYANEHEVLGELCSVNGWRYMPFYIECPTIGPANKEEEDSIKELMSKYQLPTVCIQRGDFSIFALAGKDIASILT